MLSPKRTKFRKPHRGRFRGTATRGNQIVFGDYALQALEPVWLTSRQIEATRRSITRFVKRTGKLWIRVFPDKSISCKPPETRMGSGKGAPDYWVAVIKPGHVLFEITGVSQPIAYNALKNASYKLPIKTKFISKELL
jgi:large subunit ribosomal protein L16|uniref:Large ribosomal subunit protein uL16c n=1 Tax=Guillardia theta TaxID=55529 RepID=A0A0U2K1R4_GUITH|nr:ribosomal protein L16 [Guillardia theta]|tara:strand:+ start:13760 stop:14173 length:414 start_codon:yes stop_codon:yes gene_type:complete